MAKKNIVSRNDTGTLSIQKPIWGRPNLVTRGAFSNTQLQAVLKSLLENNRLEDYPLLSIRSIEISVKLLQNAIDSIRRILMLGGYVTSQGTIQPLTEREWGILPNDLTNNLWTSHLISGRKAVLHNNYSFAEDNPITSSGVDSTMYTFIVPNMTSQLHVWLTNGGGLHVGFLQANMNPFMNAVQNRYLKNRVESFIDTYPQETLCLLSPRVIYEQTIVELTPMDNRNL